MKRLYQTPEVEIIEFEASTAVLAGIDSVPVDNFDPFTMEPDHGDFFMS